MSSTFLILQTLINNSCLRASKVIRKLALSSGVKNSSIITSKKRRKKVATVAQLLNFTEGEVKQVLWGILMKFIKHIIICQKMYFKL